VDLGGLPTRARLQRRLVRARSLLGVARSGIRVRRHLRRALLHLGVFDRILRRGGRRGLIDPDLGEEMGGLSRGALTEVGALRTGS